eukprot:Platyproteum_vivax@DN7067_c0_g1_i1.p1
MEEIDSDSESIYSRSDGGALSYLQKEIKRKFLLLEINQIQIPRMWERLRNVQEHAAVLVDAWLEAIEEIPVQRIMALYFVVNEAFAHDHYGQWWNAFYQNFEKSLDLLSGRHLDSNNFHTIYKGLVVNLFPIWRDEWNVVEPSKIAMWRDAMDLLKQTVGHLEDNLPATLPEEMSFGVDIDQDADWAIEEAIQTWVVPESPGGTATDAGPDTSRLFDVATTNYRKLQREILELQKTSRSRHRLAKEESSDDSVYRATVMQEFNQRLSVLETLKTVEATLHTHMHEAVRRCVDISSVRCRLQRLRPDLEVRMQRINEFRQER